MRLIRSLVILAVLAALVVEVGYRLLLQTEFVAAAGAGDPRAQDVSAGVGFPVTPGLVLHRTVAVDLSAVNVDLGSVVAGTVTVHATGVHLRILPSFTGRRADVTAVTRATFSAAISQEQASRTLPAGYRYVFEAGDAVLLKGPGSTLTGRLEVRAPAQVIFILPGLQTPPVMAFGGYPFSTCVQSVAVRAGTATITCTEQGKGREFFPHP